MNNIFIKFVETIKEPVKIFNIKSNKKTFDYSWDLKYGTEDIVSSDEEPVLYDNFISHNHIIKIFDEYEYSDDIVYKFKNKTQIPNLKPDNYSIDCETKNNLDLLINSVVRIKCDLCGLFLKNLMDNQYKYYKYNRYFIVNTIKYNNLKYIYNCGCELYC